MKITILSVLLVLCQIFSLSSLQAADDDYPEDEFYKPSPEAPEAPKTVDDRPPMLGVQMTPPPSHAQETNGTNPDQGVYVRRTFPDTAASDMGVQPGDIILTINGTDINSMQTLRDIVNNSKVGDEVAVTVARKGEIVNLDGEFQPWLDSVPKTKLDNNAEKRYRDMQRRRLERRMGKSSEQQKHVQQQLAKQRATRDALENTDQLGAISQNNNSTQLKALGYDEISLPAIKLSGIPFSYSLSVNVDSNEFVTGLDVHAKPETEIQVNQKFALFALIAPDFSARFHMDVSKNNSNEL